MKAPSTSFSLFELPENYYLAILIVLSIMVYANTVLNEYALDDTMMITQNKYVQNGLGGIKDILIKDSLHGFAGDQLNLQGGRYRPLSLITFAFETEFAGQKPSVGHFVNVLLFALTILFLFKLLHEFIFKEKPFTAFVATLLFALHPIHTEAVANIKGRDEILSMLFLVLCLFLLFRHFTAPANKKQFFAYGSWTCYFLALLSKENGITFLAIIPLTLYFFTNLDLKKIAASSVPFIIVFGFYLFIRFQVIGFKHSPSDEIMNNPFFYASLSERIATGIYALLIYLKLLIFPHPLSYDYSYNQITYRNFGDIEVWFSFAVHAGLIIFALAQLKKRSVWSYAILFYMISIFLVSNLLIDIGAVVSERFTFQASLGLCIAVAYGISKLKEIKLIPVKQQQTIVTGVLFTIAGLYSFKTISRNADWKNNQVLFIEDYYKVPNSIRACNAYGEEKIRLSIDEPDSQKKEQLLHDAIQVLEEAIRIDPKPIRPYLNLGLAYFHLRELEKADKIWRYVQKIEPKSITLKQYQLALADAYYKMAYDLRETDKNKAVEYMEKVSALQPESATVWLNLGIAYLNIGKEDAGIKAVKNALKFEPDNQQALAILSRNMQ